MAPGAMQIIVVILLLMVLFGAGRIPTIMENVAKGINSFKKGLKEGDTQIEKKKSSEDGNSCCGHDHPHDHSKDTTKEES